MFLWFYSCQSIKCLILGSFYSVFQVLAEQYCFYRSELGQEKSGIVIFILFNLALPKYLILSI